MTGSPVKISGLKYGIMDINDPDFRGIQGEQSGLYGRSSTPQIIFRGDHDNSDSISLAEHQSSGLDEMYPLRPGEAFLINWSCVDAMNIFYVTGNVGDILHVVVR